jgi:predicted transcriptional regulator
MIHTKIMIMDALKELHDEYDRHIHNEHYIGSMQEYPVFTIREIATKVSRSEATIRKWCNILHDEGLLEKGWKKCHFTNDSMTSVYRRKDVEPVKLIPFSWVYERKIQEQECIKLGLDPKKYM